MEGNIMSRPPLYSRAGNVSPPTELGRTGSTPHESLLGKAQQFSMFALQHVEEVRLALIRTADIGGSMITDGNSSNNNFGDKNGSEIAMAFEELAAAYDKLSSLKWDAARKVFEDSHRMKAELDTKYPKALAGSKCNGNTEKRVTVADSGESIMETRGVKEHPWQDDDDDMNPHNWISDAFLKSAISSEDDDDEAGDSFPMNGHLGSLNATAEPFASTSLVENNTATLTPPGFKSETAVQKVTLTEAEVKQADTSGHTKPTMQSFTSISSEISSLHTSSHPYTDEDYDDESDDDSDDSESTSWREDLPPLENFDFVYKGGFSMKVSGGKETKGVVPKTVKCVLIDSKTIDEGAFQGCNLLESVTVPHFVEEVGDNAFRKCSQLKTVTFLTKLPKSRRRKQLCADEKKVDKKSFRRSASAPSSITEPSSSRLRRIGDWCFFNCSTLAAVTLPYGLESIGARAFQRCSSMSMTGLPTTVTSVGENAFVGCPRETKASFDRWEKAHLN